MSAVIRFFLGIAGVCLVARGAVTPIVPGNSDRGEKLFEGQRCIACHAVNGKGVLVLVSEGGVQR